MFSGTEEKCENQTENDWCPWCPCFSRMRNCTGVFWLPSSAGSWIQVSWLALEIAILPCGLQFPCLSLLLLFISILFFFFFFEHGLPLARNDNGLCINWDLQLVQYEITDGEQRPWKWFIGEHTWWSWPTNL